MSATSPVLFTFRLIPLISTSLARAGIDATTLLDEAKLPHAALRGDVTAPLNRIQRFVDLAARALKAPLFGLDLAAAVPTGAYGVTEFLLRSCANVEAAARVLCELAPLINPIGEFEYRDGELHYRVAAQKDTIGCHLNEYTIAILARGFGGVLGRELALTRAWFSHARASHAEEVARRLRCPVQFEAPDCGFALSPEELALVPRTADQALFEFLYTQAKAQLSQVGPVDIITHVVRVIEARLSTGDVSAPDIAKAMATTTRSLQRHLGDAGTTYRDVLAHVRRRRRLELQLGGLDEARIAKQLGFADARSMRRSLDEESGDQSS
jgi:hypothetical protein